ncbi:MAG: hypothetical protein LC802_16795 [Acidobacteria bacterium]|nr:hypothetical protein [Acidobacteriota bacterium]
MNNTLATTATVKLTARQRGDFQTPEELAREVWRTIPSGQIDLVIEPTFGLGSFLTTMPGDCMADVLGWEIHENYYSATVEKLGSRAGGGEIRFLRRDVFSASISDINVSSESSVLVIGNPPWVTNSEQGVLGGENTGSKRNLKALSGLDAMTGKSNFDISEAIILHFVDLLKEHCRIAQFALLTKFSVLRNLLQFLSPYSYIGDFEFHRINSSHYFGAAVDAGLLKFKIDRASVLRRTCLIREKVGGGVVGEIGLINNRLIYDLEAYKCRAFMESDRRCEYVWRQGVKHDLSKLMELSETESGLRNGLGDEVEVEQSVLYQLFKSSDIFHGRQSRFLIPIYQRDLKDPLDDLAVRLPKLYSYLSNHETEFAARKSSIYKNRPAFSIFGIGDYTHATYKVAIGGLYSEPVFRLLEPCPRPVAVDDTSYMLATNDHEEAVYLLALLSLDSDQYSQN